MRRTINVVKAYVLCAAVSAAVVLADTIELRSGAVVSNATVVEITGNDVRFKIAGKDVLYASQKWEVARIVYANGATTVFDSQNTPQTSAPAQQPTYNTQPQPAQQPMYNTQPAQPVQQQPMYNAQPMQPVYQPAEQFVPPAAQPTYNTRPAAEPAAIGTAAATADIDDDASFTGARFGVRGAFSGYNVAGGGGAEDMGGGGAYGWGASIGVEASVPISNSVAFKPEVSFTYRIPLSVPSGGIDGKNSTEKELKLGWKGGSSIREVAICVPLLLRADLTSGRKFFADIGVEVDFAFGTKIYINDVSYDEYYGIVAEKRNETMTISDLRTIPDFGLVYGFGFHVTDNCAISLRHVTYINSAIKITGMFYNRTDIGVTLFL